MGGGGAAGSTGIFLGSLALKHFRGPTVGRRPQAAGVQTPAGKGPQALTFPREDPYFNAPSRWDGGRAAALAGREPLCRVQVT